MKRLTLLYPVVIVSAAVGGYGVMEVTRSHGAGHHSENSVEVRQAVDALADHPHLEEKQVQAEADANQPTRIDNSRGW